MKTLIFVVLLRSWVFPLFAQQTASAANNATVPPLVSFSGRLKDLNGKPVTGVVGVTFYLYQEQDGGAPLWTETQNIEPDKSGHYTVTLGSTSTYGLPADIFAAGKARWLGVQPEGQPEQPRVLLVSVPYALKAADAETLGGKPLSAFQLATPESGISSQTALTEQANEIRCSGSANCKTGFIPEFSSNGGSATVTDSIVTQSGTSIGIAGNLTMTGTLNASSGQVLGQTGVFRGNNNGAIFQATQNSSTTGAAIAGLALGTGGVGVQGSGITGVTGFGLSNGTGVAGTGGTGVSGQGGSSGFTQGLFGLSSSSIGIGTLSIGVGKSKVGTSLFGCCAVGVWGDTNQSTAGAAALVGTADDAQGLVVANNSTNQLAASIKNFENTTHNVQIFNATGAFGSCNMDTDGNLGCTGRVKGNNLVKTTTANNPILITCPNTRCAFATMSNMSLSINTGSVPVLILGQVGGINMPDCDVLNIDLFVDGGSVDHAGVQPHDGGATASTTLTSIQSLAPGSHTVEIDWNPDSTACPDPGGIANASIFNSTRSLTVVELAGAQQ